MIFTPKTELELYSIYERAKKIKVCTKENEIIIGSVQGFTSAINNEPSIPEIDIKLENGNFSGIYLDEINTIELL